MLGWCLIMMDIAAGWKGVENGLENL